MPIISIKHAKISCLSALLLILGGCQSTQILTEVQNADVTGNARAVISSPLAPFKDERFAYRSALEVRDNGNFLRAPYNEQKDINKRDELPVRKVREGYITRFSKHQIQDLKYQGTNTELATFAVGNSANNSTMTVIYLHGRNGNRTWGFDDERFGGNFNRVKNLMLANGGAYFSPDFTDFDETGTQDIVALLEQQRTHTSGDLVLACGSLGSKICWAIANNPTYNVLIDGMILLGGMRSEKFEVIANSGRKFPIYIAHGSRDKTFKALELEAMYDTLRAKNYPVRMTVFESGNHGTPVRMIDWRQALNWIASK